MFRKLHKRLTQKYETYRDWHLSSWADVKNSSILLLYSLLIAFVSWIIWNPRTLSGAVKPKVLGAAIGPSNLAEEMERVEITIVPIKLNLEDSYAIRVNTSKVASVWVEFDDVVDRKLFKTAKTPFDTTHLIILNYLTPDVLYVYRVGAEDESGNVLYSRFYSFQK